MTFKEVYDAERAAWKLREDTELDVRIAERSGGDVDACKALAADALTEWHSLRMKLKSAGNEFAKEHGFRDGAELHSATY